MHPCRVVIYCEGVLHTLKGVPFSTLGTFLELHVVILHFNSSLHSFTDRELTID